MNKNYCLYCMSELDAQGRCPKCGEPPKIESEFHQLPAGSVLAGRYLVGRVLGEGGFGITYIGCDTHLKLKVAIKEYYPKDYASRNTTYSQLDVTGRKSDDNFEKGKAKFLREAQTMALMDKQRVIVGVRDHFEENGTAYIIMEYIEGETLAALTEKREGKISPDELFPLIEPIFDALTSLHSAGLIHRDISPDNIMIERGSIRLIDLGVARDTTESAMTATITVKQNYAPIEQFQSEGQGPQTDIYALGATLYYCLTGTVPARALDRIINDKIKPLAEYGVDLPPYQEQAIMKALSLRSDDRFASAAEMHDAIYNAPAVPVRKTRNLPAPRASAVPKTQKPAKAPAVKAPAKVKAPAPAKETAAKPAKGGRSLAEVISGSAALAAAVAALIVVNVTGSKAVPVSEPSTTAASASAAASSSETAAPDVTEPPETTEDTTAAEKTNVRRSTHTDATTTPAETEETTILPAASAIDPDAVRGDYVIDVWNGQQWKDYAIENNLINVERFFIYLDGDKLSVVGSVMDVVYDTDTAFLYLEGKRAGHIEFSDDLKSITLTDNSGLSPDVIVASRVDYEAIADLYLGNYKETPEISDINCEWVGSDYNIVVDSNGLEMRYEPGEYTFMQLVPRGNLFDMYVYDDDNGREMNLGYIMCDEDCGKLMLYSIYSVEPTIFTRGEPPTRAPYYGEWVVKDGDEDSGNIFISDYFVSVVFERVTDAYIIFFNQNDDIDINKAFRLYTPSNDIQFDDPVICTYDADTDTLHMVHKSRQNGIVIEEETLVRAEAIS